MSGKPKSSQRLSCKRRESTDDDIYGPTQNLNTASTTTPVRVSKPPEDEESPYFLCSTQELQDEVDVLWKWNSPQMKQFMNNTKRPKKRLLMQTSPKIPLRRHPSSDTQTQKDFAKLREELNSLKEELNMPNDEVSLALSPREEKQIKDEVKFLETNVIDEMMHQDLDQPWHTDSEDPFNDDMEDIMVQCSQQVEALLSNPTKAGGDSKLLILKNGQINAGSTTTSSSSNFGTSSSTTTSSNSNFGPSSSTNSDRQDVGSSGYSTNNKLFSEKNTNSLTSKPHSNQPVKSITTNLQQKTRETTNPLPVLSDNNSNKNKFSFKKNTSPGRCISDLNREWNPTQELVHRLVSERVINIDNNMDCGGEIPELNKNTTQSIQNDSIFDDSFDMVLSQMPDDDLDQLTQVADIKTFTRSTHTNNPSKYGVSHAIQTLIGTCSSLTNGHSEHSSSSNSTLVDQNHPQINRTTGNQNKKNSTNSVEIRTTCTNVIQTSTTVKSVQNLITKQKSSSFPRCNSDGGFGQAGGKVQTASGKMEFHRTKSFEICNDSMLKSNKTTDQIRTNLQPLPEFTDSPIKCSPDEIEKKRLAALAIREAKKQREIIEKNRQDALKKLEEKRKRNVDNVKSSLVKRL